MSDAQVPSQPPPPPPPPSSAAPPPAPSVESSNRTVMIILAYLGPLALIPFFVEQRDQEIRWHAKHGLVLLVAEIIVWTVLFIFTAAATAVIEDLGCILWILLSLVGLGLTMLHIVCMVKGIGGQRFTIPGLSELANRF